MSVDNKMQPYSPENSWQMFDRIAPTYDRLNRVLSLGVDKRWRKKLVNRIPVQPNLSLIDIATGTGDQLFAACRKRTNIAEALGVDMADKMLDVARAKLAKRAHETADIAFKRGDACQLPAADNLFDVATITFGIRNVSSVPQGLCEMHRVLNAGGRALILEFGVPRSRIFRPLYLTYFRHVLPRIGGLLSGDRKAYRYLNQTSEQFPCGEAFSELMRDAGFVNVTAKPLSLGIAYLYEGEKAK